MNGYIAFYDNKRLELYAETLWEATVKARVTFRAPKSRQHLVTVMLAEQDGEPVVHTPDF